MSSGEALKTISYTRSHAAKETDINNALQACYAKGFSNNNPYPAVVENGVKIRKLTPKECFRLMGFSDEDFEKAKEVNSNTQLYKQAGNSIVVNVLEFILAAILSNVFDHNSMAAEQKTL